MKIAIIGAGMAGLSCGQELLRMGHDVSLFDKGRGPGGRMATRRMEQDGQTFHFDHGAQYFTARDPRFVTQVADWEAAGVVARWPDVSADAFVGTPGMNGPIRAMAEAQQVRFSCRVDKVARVADGWRLEGEGTPDDRYDSLIIAVPAEQAAPLMSAYMPDFAAQAAKVISAPCWTVMAAFAQKLEAPDSLRPSGAIGWAARNSAKPARDAGECWVVQANPDWSRQHLELEREEIIALLLAELANELGAIPQPLAVTAHRWRYAMVPRAGGDVLWDGSQAIGACGDWLEGPRVENAYLSGLKLAQRIGAESVARPDRSGGD